MANQGYLVVTSTPVTIAGSGSSNVSAPHNLLDGNIDQDTTVSAVGRGDIIIGNSTPKWTRQAVGTGVLVADGTDVTGWTQAPTLTTPSMTTPVVSTQINLTGGQIKFPATQVASSDANTLDDYEEGSWTPVVGGATSESGQSYTAQVGRYLKEGSWVLVSAYVELSAKGTITGNIAIKGLPFTAKNTTNQLVATPMYWGALATSWVYITGLLVNNTTQTLVRGATAAATGSETSLATADIGNTSKFILFIGYETTG